MPKFSVIIPVYNAEKYIDECVQSLLNQKYKDFELILVNDCSTDNSLELCKHYEKQDNRVMVLSQEKNQGVSAARNHGLEHASGKYILFVDSDDFVAENYFETLDLLTANSSRELIVFGNYDYVISDKNKPTVSLSSMNCNITSTEEDAWNKLFLNSFFASPCNKIFLREILVQYGIRFDAECVCYEDYIFNVEYCKHIDHFTVSDKPLYYYRQFANVSHTSKRRWGEFLAITHKVVSVTNSFIELKGNAETLKDLRRYGYQSYLVELKAAKERGDKLYNREKTVMKDKDFQESLYSIISAGTKIKVLRTLIKLRLYRLGSMILSRLI